MSRRAGKTGRTRFERGSGNVFADLGFAEPERVLAKARLAESLADTIRRRSLRQDQAAAAMGVDQGTVSRLVNGRLDGFSQERLIRYLTALGDDVEIVVRHAERFEGEGHLKVTRA